ncbi:hypothetical protein GCM10017673_26100 [Streptosporangium violaceochromogenes]|nr:hypothetical protein GCM10017673_26100 [Streptosporangium violaceochromogenes]
MTVSAQLSTHLRHKGAAMRDAARRRPKTEDWDETIGAECVADDLTGVRKLRIRDWRYIGDGGADIGGWNLGPSSPELLCGVISTCLTHTYLCLAAMRGLPLDRVSVRVVARNNDAGFFEVPGDRPIHPHELTAYVRIDAAEMSPDEIAAFVAEGEQRCPIAYLVRNPVDLTVRACEQEAGR